MKRTRISEGLRPFIFYLIMKKFFTFIVLCVFSIGTIHAKITWSLSDDGTLTISGTDMPNYGYNDCPWNSQRNRIKKIVIENGVTNIVNFAFCNCKNLTLIIIPSSVLEIGQSAFSSCSSLSSITIPNSVKSIGSQAFSYCSGLTSITLPNSVMSIGELTFSECSNLKSVTIDNSEICIGTSAFSGCSNLISVNMGNSTTSIESLAFYKCISLKICFCLVFKPYINYNTSSCDKYRSICILWVF